MTSTSSLPPPAGSSLRRLILAAYAADPSDQLIAPFGEQKYSTIFGVIPATLAVLRVAAEVEPNPLAAVEWYERTPIREFGDLTAERLVALDRAEMVIAFLRSIRDGIRG